MTTQHREPGGSRRNKEEGRDWSPIPAPLASSPPRKRTQECNRLTKEICFCTFLIKLWMLAWAFRPSLLAKLIRKASHWWSSDTDVITPWTVEARERETLLGSFKTHPALKCSRKNCHRGTHEGCGFSLFYTTGLKRELKEINYIPC